MPKADTSADRLFDSAAHFLANMDAQVVASVVHASTDLALIIDASGVIRDISFGVAEPERLDELQLWVGRRWLDTVTVESRVKISALLDGAQRGESDRKARRTERQVNHPLAGGTELPVGYRVVSLGDQGGVLALGRDLRTIAGVQQRLVEAQQAMERDYLRLRQTEARYRVLFEAVEEPLLVIDALSMTIFEVNAAASQLLGEQSKRILGRTFTDYLHPRSRPAVSAMLAQARAMAPGEEVPAQLAAHEAPVRLHFSTFRQDSATLLLVRLNPGTGSTRGAVTPASARLPSLATVANAMPDAFVLTDVQGRILSANEAFSEMLQLGHSETLVNQSLDRWLGRSSVDLNVLISNLRQHGVLRLFPTTLRGNFGESIAVEISAVAVADSEQGPACLGFSIRDVGRRLGGEVRAQRQLPRSADQLTGLVGRMPLKDIVGETTDLIERLCIEAALELTRDNRASAAEMLGLSRQSLYVKLRRYGLRENAPGAGEPEA